MSENAQKPRIRFKGFSDAWEQRKLGDVLQTLPFKVYLKSPEQDGEFEIIQQGNTPIIGYANGEPCKDYEDTVIFGDHTLSLYKPKSPFFVATDGVRIVKGFDNMDGNYLLPLLERNKPQSEGYKRYYSILADIDVFFTENHEEQSKIGEYFSDIDNLITLHQRKYDKLVAVKKALLEKMFPADGETVPKIRFKGFSDAWEQRKAKELFNSTADKGYPELPVLSATQDRGMIRRDENSINIFHDKKNESGYKRVLPGQFVIHLRSFQGGFAHSTLEGITSPAYTVFGFSEPEKHDSEYWKYVFTSKEFIRRLETVTYGIRDGRSISYDEFLTLDFVYPSKAEQTAIARYLDKLSDFITLHQRQLEKLKNIKSALLEKMFV